MKHFLFTILLSAISLVALGQDYNQMTEDGIITRADERRTARQDSTSSKGKVVPKGFYTWNVDFRLGDITRVNPDTASYLFMNTALTNGLEHEYNFLGNLGSPRYNRTYIDRKDEDMFIFTNHFDYFITNPNEFRFINTLSPLTNLSYNTCGDRTNGEDHLTALFATNANKRLGFGFLFDYLYGRGYYQNQSTSLFDYSLFGSYIGDRYQAHFIASLNHQKQAENGGITDDNYITHPESFNDDYRENEIPTYLSSNWNRNDNQHVAFTHKYSFGFHREEPLSEAEIEARKFAIESKKEEQRQAEGDNYEETDDKIADPSEWTKKVYVPVTSLIHSISLNNYRRIYQAYDTPENYYLNEYYNTGSLTGDSIYDKTRHLSLKNTFAIAMLEGFNKWAKAGVKLFATHKFEHFTLPSLTTSMESHNQQTLFVGGQIRKQEGKTIHYNLEGTFGVAGCDAGEIDIQAEADANIPLAGSELEAALAAYIARYEPTYYYLHYHSRHAWWENDGLDNVFKNGISLQLTYPRSGTAVKIALDNVKNYTFFTVNYNLDDDNQRVEHDYGITQKSGNINVFTAQLRQDFSIKPVHLNLSATYQKSSDQTALALPDLDLYANLFLRFRIAKVLRCDLGVDLRYFSSFRAQEYVPYIAQFANNIAENGATEIGNYPFINIYANFHLKQTRFFIMGEHINAGAGNKRYFLTPHYPTNGRIIRFGLSWNFFN